MEDRPDSRLPKVSRIKVIEYLCHDRLVTQGIKFSSRPTCGETVHFQQRYEDEIDGEKVVL